LLQLNAKANFSFNSNTGICDFLGKWCVELSTVVDPESALSHFVNNSLQDEIMSPEEIACAAVVCLLGVSYYKSDYAKQALQAFSFCLQASVIHQGRPCPEAAKYLLNMARIYFEINDFHRCIQASRHAFTLQNDCSIGEQKLTKADALHHLNFSRALLSIDGPDNEARLHLELAVDILEQRTEQSSERQGSPSVGRSLRTAELIGTDATCTELLLECYYSTLLIVRRQNPKPNVTEEEAEILQHIGNAEATLGYYEKAKKTFTEVLEALKLIHGSDHLSVADVLFNLGNVLSELQEVDSARRCHEESHSIASQILGADNTELAENLICLGNVEFSCEKYNDALGWYDRALLLLRSLHADQDFAIGKVLQRKVSSTPIHCCCHLEVCLLIFSSYFATGYCTRETWSVRGGY
jgi:tetratricopeptide (TPR) repeat protein